MRRGTIAAGGGGRGIVIRPVLTAREIRTVADLAGTIWRQHYPPLIGVAQTEYMVALFQSPAAIRRQIAEGAAYYLAAEDGRPVGYMALVSSPSRRDALLSKLYVRREARRRGIGRALVDFAAARCREQGLRRLRLTVNRGNKGSIAFYRRVGFEMDGTVVQDIGGGFVMDDYRMTRSLARRDQMTRKTPEETRALIVFGGWSGHDPVLFKDRVAEWMRAKEWSVTAADTLDILLDRAMPARTDVIVMLWTMGQISGEQSKALREAVAAGTGLAGWHGGMCDAFRQDTDYQFMTGGQWVAHPGGIVPYTVRIVADDPIVRGLRDFRMRSEQYYMHVDPGNEVLATTTFSGRHGGVPWIRGTVMPQVWKRRWGRGRVFYSALGHVIADFDVPEAFEIAQRGIQGAARRPVVPEFKGG